MGPFEITIQYTGNKTYRLIAKRTNLFPNTERWEVTAKNHTFILDCNRPILAKKNLDHLPWDWKLISGKCPDWFLKDMTNEIRKTIQWINKI